MDRHSRRLHYPLIVAAYLLITLPNLGQPTLWDMDEGVNAEAGREMLESGNWITPYYNYQIRVAKPALLYWLQASSFAWLGVNEFAARLPSVLCCLICVLATYELGRVMFSPSTGLLSALALSSCLEFAVIAHAATPDPPLIAFTTLAMLCFWSGSRDGRRWWFVPTAFFCGLAMLTKGPIGVGIPGLIILIYLVWSRRLGILWDRRMFTAIAVFLLVSLPWYIMVTVETRGVWTKAFFFNENMARFQDPMDNHSGGFYYHAVLLLALFAPWSFVIIPTLWIAVREARKPAESTVRPVESSMPSGESPLPYRFLLTAFLLVITIFSIAATKLPNYILPLYPPLAILSARLLDRWRLRLLELPSWVWAIAIVGYALVGIVTLGACLLVSGKVFWIESIPLRKMPDLLPCASLGVIPILAAILFAIARYRQQRTAAIRFASVGAVLYAAGMCAVFNPAFNPYKAPQMLAQGVGLPNPDKEVRLACYKWLRHSTVFYTRREVRRLNEIKDVKDFMAMPGERYLFVSSKVWQTLQEELPDCEVHTRQYDLLINDDVLAIRPKTVN